MKALEHRNGYAHWAVAAGLALALGACGGSSSTTSDASTGGPDQGSALETCGEGCRELVVNKITVPLTTPSQGGIAKDLDGDGKADNGLAKLLSAFSSFYDPAEAQVSLDEEVNEGSALLVLRMVQPSAANTMLARAWTAEADCCPSASSAEACAAVAPTTCFSGSYQFTPVEPHYDLSGSVANGDRVTLGPAVLQLSLTVFGDIPYVWTVKGAQIEGRLTATGLVDATLFGAFGRQDLEQGLLVPLVAMANEILQGEDSQAKGVIASIVDLNGDGTVTLDEAKSVSLIRDNLLAGDVDIDGDGLKDLSFGFGFTAVNARLGAPVSR